MSPVLQKKGHKRSLLFRLQMSSCHCLCSMLHDNKHLWYCRKTEIREAYFLEHRHQIVTTCVLCYITTEVTSVARKGAITRQLTSVFTLLQGYQDVTTCLICYVTTETCVVVYYVYIYIYMCVCVCAARSCIRTRVDGQLYVIE